MVIQDFQNRQVSMISCPMGSILLPIIAYLGIASENQIAFYYTIYKSTHNVFETIGTSNHKGRVPIFFSNVKVT
jgi:hypothetical protein